MSSKNGTAEGGHPTNGTDTLIDFAAERKVAERLLRLGKGTVLLGNKERQPIGELKAPLPAEPFCILNADFHGADLTDDELAALAGCRAIEKLVVAGNKKLKAAGLVKLGPLPFLKELFIDESGIDDPVIAWLSNIPSLTNFTALNNPISAAGCRPNERLRSIRCQPKPFIGERLCGARPARWKRARGRPDRSPNWRSIAHGFRSPSAKTRGAR